MASQQQEEAKSRETMPFILVAPKESDDMEIEVKNLTVTTPGKNGITLVKDVNLTLKKGDKVIMTGASGSGKTTVAKSFLNHWDHGTGIISMPEGIKTMGMAQKAYFPDVTLRSVMNLLPEGRSQFEDKELTKALQAVGLDQLIQHIPGQQTELMMDDLLKDIEDILKPFADEPISEPKLESIHHSILSRIVYLVEEQFNTVQYTPDAQREYFREKFAALFAEKLRDHPLPEKVVENLAKNLLNEIDIELARPLAQTLSDSMEDLADRHKAFFSPYTPHEIEVLSKMLHAQMDKRLQQYRDNKDTDDVNREIRINKIQADFVADLAAKRLTEVLEDYNTSRVTNFLNKGAVQPVKKLFNAIGSRLPSVIPEAVKRPVRGLFNASASTTGWVLDKATWPLRKAFQAATLATNRFSLYTRARSMANEMMQNTTFFMARQVVTGDELTNGSRLSGGQKQKLMIATVLVHKPDVLILDEITASLDPAGGKKLYKEMMEALPDDTIVLSIAHNENIREFHTHHAELADQTITLTKISPEDPDETPSIPHEPEEESGRPEGPSTPPDMSGPQI